MEKWHLTSSSMCVYAYFLDVQIDVKAFQSLSSTWWQLFAMGFSVRLIYKDLKHA